MENLNTLIHARVDDERADVDRLVAVAVRAGTRIRRRRAVGYAGAGLAAAAAVSVGAAVVSAHGGTTAAEIAPAAGGSPSDGLASTAPVDSATAALQAGQTLMLGHGVTGTVISCTAGTPDRIGGNPACLLPARYLVVAGSTVPGPGTGLAVLLTGPSAAVEGFWINGFQSPLLAGSEFGLSYALPADSPLLRPVYQGQAVAIHLAGWRQVGPVGDDKQALVGPGGQVADIVWRAASGYDDWMAGMKDDLSTWTSPVHDGVFVTIQAGAGVSPAEVRALGASLTWK